MPVANLEKIKPCLQRVLVLQDEASSHRFVEETWEQQEQLPHFDHSHIRRIVNPFTISGAMRMDVLMLLETKTANLVQTGECCRELASS